MSRNAPTTVDNLTTFTADQGGLTKFRAGVYQKLALVGPDTDAATLGALVTCDVSAGAITVNLPDPDDGVGGLVLVKMITAAANTITIQCAGFTIDGASNLVLSLDFEWALLMTDGANWIQVG